MMQTEDGKQDHIRKEEQDIPEVFALFFLSLSLFSLLLFAYWDCSSILIPDTQHAVPTQPGYSQGQHSGTSPGVKKKEFR